MATKRATTLRLIRNIDFSDNYDHVILFDSVEEQTEYFLGRIGLEFEEFSYQRVDSGYIKVNAQMKGAWRYCYLMFKNSSHEDKWWYAFIDSVEYVNDTTVGIKFHLDVMQSYMFDYTLGQSFVVREHSTTDVPGDNIVPENIYYGDYEYDWSFNQLEVDGSDCPFGFSGKLDAKDMCIVIAYNPAIVDLLEAAPESLLWKENLYGGVYQGVRFICLPFTTKQSEAQITEMVQTMDKLLGCMDFLSFGGIMGIYMMPIIFLPDKNKPSWDNVRRYVDFDPPSGFLGYTPKNKKLLTYPYVAFNVTNGRTNGNDYAYEYFIARKPTFACEGTLSLNPSCICYPVGYMGKTFATEDGVTLDGYPLATWGQDGFSEWLSNHFFQTAIGIGLTAATAGASAYVATAGNLIGAVSHYAPTLTSKQVRNIVSASPSTAQMLANNYAGEQATSAVVSTAERGLIGAVSQASATPPSAHGVNAHDLLFGNPFGSYIQFRRKCIRAEYARKLDDYFTRYGYAVNEVKVPNLKSRPFWNYIELKNPHLEGINFPMNVAKEIMSVYERGVTFWRPSSTIGDYENQNNSAKGGS